MKTITYRDSQGKLHRSMVRNIDDDPHIGIPQDPPDVSNLDWAGIANDLHNELTARGLATYADLSRNQQDLSGAILAAVKTRVINLFKESK